MRAEGKAVYRQRAKAECVNADLRNRGVQRLMLRGRDKVRAVLLWFAVAHNCAPWHCVPPRRGPRLWGEVCPELGKRHPVIVLQSIELDIGVVMPIGFLPTIEDGGFRLGAPSSGPSIKNAQPG